MSVVVVTGLVTALRVLPTSFISSDNVVSWTTDLRVFVVAGLSTACSILVISNLLSNIFPAAAHVSVVVVTGLVTALRVLPTSFISSDNVVSWTTNLRVFVVAGLSTACSLLVVSNLLSNIRAITAHVGVVVVGGASTALRVLPSWLISSYHLIPRAADLRVLVVAGLSTA